MKTHAESLLARLSDPEKQQLVSTRRQIHRHPELAFEETRTAALVAERLRSLDLSPRTGVGKTGVTADYGRDGPILMLRADMDGLPIAEANDVPYRSEEPGKMHACGHDGHVAIGLAVAERLNANPPATRIRSLFQPAEETTGGAESMVADGALEGVRAALGLHLWNQIPFGQVGVNRGALMAAVDEFEITVVGRGGHGAAPHETVDPVLAAARLIEALQSVVSREISPLEAAVVTVGRVVGGTAFNVIPDSVTMNGTVRSFHPAVWQALPKKIERIVAGTTAACGATYRFRYIRKNRATTNSHEMADVFIEVATEWLGKENVDTETRTMGGEDMSVYLQQVPGCFFFVGSAPPGAHRPHHAPRFEIDERALALGTLLLEETARRTAERLIG